MKICCKKIPLTKLFFLFLYYGVVRYLPKFLGGKFWRYTICRHIFKSIKKGANIEKGAFFGSGLDLCLGERSGLGVNCVVPSDIVIGDNVMMGPNCFILNRNHAYDRSDIPMIDQGFSEKKQTIIEDDVWIGRDVIFTPGRRVKSHSIIAAGCVLCKDFPEYSIIGGNPSRLIKKRLDS